MEATTTELASFAKVKTFLQSQQLKFQTFEHEATVTSTDAAKIRGTDVSTGAKAMVAQSKDRYFLFVLQANKKIDWRKVKELVGSKDVSLLDQDLLESKVGIPRGGVHPLGNLLGLETYYDKGLLELTLVNFNAGSRYHSVQMEITDLVRIVGPRIEEFVAQ